MKTKEHHRHLKSIYKDFEQFYEKKIPKKTRKDLVNLVKELREGLLRKYPEIDYETVHSVISWSLEKVAINFTYEVTVIEEQLDQLDDKQTTLNRRRTNDDE